MLQFSRRFAFFINFSSFKPDTENNTKNQIPNIVKIDPYNFELYRFKVDAAFLQRVSIACYAKRCISYRKSVCLSVCLTV